MENRSAVMKFALLFVAALAFIFLVLFLPAGDLNYWQAWLYMAIIFIPAFFVILYLSIKDPEFLKRRMRYREKEFTQQKIIGAASILLLVGFIIPGLDYRFSWSFVPVEQVLAADFIVVLGYMICVLVFKENSFAGRTIEVEKGQKVITTGPYSIIRHPMYFGVLLMYLATPVALGSYYAVPPFLLIIPVLIYRILNEEEVLLRELPGYTEYCKKTRFRLLPHVW